MNKSSLANSDTIIEELQTQVSRFQAGIVELSQQITRMKNELREMRKHLSQRDFESIAPCVEQLEKITGQVIQLMEITQAREGDFPLKLELQPVLQIAQELESYIFALSDQLQVKSSLKFDAPIKVNCSILIDSLRFTQLSMQLIRLTLPGPSCQFRIWYTPDFFHFGASALEGSTILVGIDPQLQKGKEWVKKMNGNLVFNTPQKYLFDLALPLA